MFGFALVNKALFHPLLDMDKVVSMVEGFVRDEV